MTAPGFDLVDVEPRLYVRGEFGELHFCRSRGGRSAPILRWENEVAKGIRGHSQAVTRVGGKSDVRLSWIRCRVQRRQQRTSGQHYGLGQELSARFLHVPHSHSMLYQTGISFLTSKT